MVGWNTPVHGMEAANEGRTPLEIINSHGKVSARKLRVLVCWALRNPLDAHLGHRSRHLAAAGTKVPRSVDFDRQSSANKERIQRPRLRLHPMTIKSMSAQSVPEPCHHRRLRGIKWLGNGTSTDLLSICLSVRPSVPLISIYPTRRKWQVLAASEVPVLMKQPRHTPSRTMQILYQRPPVSMRSGQPLHRLTGCRLLEKLRICSLVHHLVTTRLLFRHGRSLLSKCCVDRFSWDQFQV